MKKAYRGSCHCGAIQFQATLELAAGTTRCNCSFCRKARFWMAFVKASEFELLAGAGDLSDYQYTPVGRPEPFLHLSFCKHCGIRPFSKGGSLPRFDGEFYAVNLACLDDATDEELAAASIHYADGRKGQWENEAKESTYL